MRKSKIMEYVAQHSGVSYATPGAAAGAVLGDIEKGMRSGRNAAEFRRSDGTWFEAVVSVQLVKVSDSPHRNSSVSGI